MWWNWFSLSLTLSLTVASPQLAVTTDRACCCRRSSSPPHQLASLHSFAPNRWRFTPSPDLATLHLPPIQQPFAFPPLTGDPSLPTTTDDPSCNGYIFFFYVNFCLMILVPLGFFFFWYSNGYMYFCLVWVFYIYCVMIVKKVS